MKIPLFSLTRRQAFAGVAASAVNISAMAEDSGQIRTATLVALKRNGEQEMLLKMALTNDHLFALWSTRIAKGTSRLACCALNGEQRWSTGLGSVPVFALLASGGGEATTVVIDKESAKVVFAKYGSQGALNEEDTLPLNNAVLAAGASSADICVLDVNTSLSIKRFRGSGAPRHRPPAFDTPAIGGLKPRAIIASVHFLENQLVLLDHVKARSVAVFPDGGQRPGRVAHPSIDAAIQKQDEDVAGRAAPLRSSGNEHTVTFPVSISLAASDGASAIWVVPQPATGSIPVLRLNPALSVTAEPRIRIPAGLAVEDRPPLMLGATQSLIALGFREGVVALAGHGGA
jgi:hypothetical protein